nr:DUF2087 domain-containing protein [uncultured Rhodococcus sp.]
MSASSEDRTGSSSEILSGLVTLIRPTNVLSVGSGSSTIALARALESVGRGIAPRLVSFADDGGDSSVERFARENRPRFDFVEPIDGSLFDMPPRHLRDVGPFDLVWIDGESLAADARFVRALWPHVRSNGILAMENSYLPAEANPLWNAILRFCADDVEAMTLPRADADDSTGVGLLRRRPDPVREVNFTDDMVAATGVPLRFESIGIHDDAPLPGRATGVLHALADPDLRTVLFAIGSGITTVAALQSHTGLPGRALHKAIARLFALSVVTRVDDRLVVDEKTFEEFRELPRTTPPPTQMSRYTRDRTEFLKAIAYQLSSTTWSSEHQVNELCRFFDDDYATLRRELVDTGFLERNSAGSMYRALGKG